MDVDEYARLARGLGEAASLSGGVWWRRARPLFYRQLFPFEALENGVGPPVAGKMGGWQYAVAPGQEHNSYLNYAVFKDLQDYDLGTLKHKERQNVRKAAGKLTYRRMTDLAEIVSRGLPLIQAFYAGTSYGWRRDLAKPDVFRGWASELVSCPKVVVMGAFREDELCELHVSYRVRDVIFFDATFTSPTGRHLYSSEGILDLLRREAAFTDARFICVGPAGGKPTLDRFKCRRGAKITAIPARLALGGLGAVAMRMLSEEVRRRLVGMDESLARAYMEEAVK